MKSRPTTIEEMRERGKRLFSADGYKKGLSIKLRSTDVVIAPFAKSGTTWTQQIVHTLRTRGDMDFDDISRVVPWIEVSPGLGIDLDAEQRAEPRAFKSHLSWDDMPRGGRYINVMRDPGDVAVSMFKFQEGWFLEPGCVTADELTRAEFLENRNYFKHLRSWWPRRNDDDVLFLQYEQMLDDPATTITRIAAFVGIELDETLLDLTLEHSSVEFMLAHKDRFDDAMLRKHSETVCDLPEGSDSAKIRVGKQGGRVALEEATLALIDKAWLEEITPHFGFRTYAEMGEALRAERAG